ncbi:MAG TPA: PilZ domain-containing protein [Candidatus Acidoferrales bacterium]|nr:PilZ domain-containing protein [Candidatus Acidoferrales bacterium]
MSRAAELMNRRSDRIFVRLPADISFHSQDGPVSYQAATIDFSALGARVETVATLVPGDSVQLILSGKARPPLPSRVVWSARRGPDRQAESGLEFLQPLRV